MATKRQSAFNRALQEAQNTEQSTSGQPVPPSDSEPVQPFHRPTVGQPNGETVKPLDRLTVRPSDSEAVKRFNRETVPPYNRETVKPLDSETVSALSGEAVKPLDSETVPPFHRQAVKGDLEKTSFYIRHDQVEKLDDLAHDYKKRTGKRINRNDIVRALIDQIDLEKLLSSIGF